MLNPFSMFSRIYCINLDSRPDRWEECVKEFKAMDILDMVERVPGIVYTLSNDPKRNACIGNHLSHARCFLKAKEEEATTCLIFEDDVQFFFNKRDTYDLLEVAMMDLIFDFNLWDMLYLGINLDRWKAKRMSQTIARLEGGFSTHAYAASDWMFDKLIEANTNIDIVHNDVYYAEHIIPNHKVYVTIPLLCGQRESFSDIEGKIMKSNPMFLERFENGLY